VGVSFVIRWTNCFCVITFGGVIELSEQEQEQEQEEDKKEIGDYRVTELSEQEQEQELLMILLLALASGMGWQDRSSMI